uniref:hypothetical protein n=1 Tax=Caloramator sp. Dgby_cultured_2 TaxID=3029174 RepID=UPI003157F87B
MKLNKLERSWALYDWANSAYSMTVTSTILPLYFKMITDSAGIEKTFQRPIGVMQIPLERC